MTINIKDPEIDRMVRELAKSKHMKMTEVVREAISAFHAAEMKDRQDRIRHVYEVIEALPEKDEGFEEPLSSNHDWLYDENGVPK